MNFLEKNYKIEEIDNVIEEFENLDDLMKNNDVLGAQSVFSSVFIYSIMDKQLIPDITNYVLDSEYSKEIKAIISFETALYFEELDDKDIANYYFENAVKLQRQLNLEGDLTLPMILMHMKKYEEAIIEFNKSQDREYNTLMNIANCYMKNEDFKNAIEIYKEIMSISTNKSDTLFLNEQIGWCYMYLHDYETADKYFLAANIVNNIHLLIDTTYYFEMNDEIDLAIRQLYRMVDLGEESVLDKIHQLEKENKN